MRSWFVRTWMLALLLAACKTGDAAPDGALPPDAAPDAMPPPDAPLAREARDLTSAGGRAAGATYTIEVQLGHPLGQGSSAGGGRTLEGGAAVKP